jgi:hypothetical protein
MSKDCDMMTQSSLSTGTWLLGFLMVGGGVVSHIRTEGDKRTVSTREKPCTGEVQSFGA